MSRDVPFTLWIAVSLFLGMVLAMGSIFIIGFGGAGEFVRVFWGPAERFMHMDADQLVLRDLQPYLDTIAAAEGSVKPIHASSPPNHPARMVPIAMPTWLLAGPGRNWHSATRSE